MNNANTKELIEYLEKTLEYSELQENYYCTIPNKDIYAIIIKLKQLENIYNQ